MKIFVNCITTFRFCYTLFLPLIKSKVSNTFFIINIIILFLTDSIDGTLARKFNVQTVYGSGMDTIADKALTIMLLILISERIPVLALVIMLELIIFVISVIGLCRKKKMKVNLFGKIKMWLLSITIVLSYLNYFNIINYNIVLILGIPTVIFQILTMSTYLKKFLDKEENNHLEIPKIKGFEEIKYILFDTEYYKMLYN